MKRNASTRRSDRPILSGYGRWMQSAAYCVKCMSMHDLQLAHIRGYAQGYIKPPPEHTVPLCFTCHKAQESDRTFWRPLSVQEAQDQAAAMFKAYEVAADIGMWSGELATFHDMLRDRAG